MRLRLTWSLGLILTTSSVSQAGPIGSLSTPESSGLVSGAAWAPPPASDGFRVDWEIQQNLDDTWHYAYTFSTQDMNPLSPGTSHFIIQLSENIQETDIFNIKGDFGEPEFGTFGPGSGNPGFPTGESIFGLKLNAMTGYLHVEFDSNRQPMWADFYAKGGKDSFAYNTDLGVEVADPSDYTGFPVDAQGNKVHKILAPDTVVPEPSTVGLLMAGFGLIGLRPRQFRGASA